MDDVTQRLEKCFTAVFPGLSAEQIRQASSDTLSQWDSMASVTLLAVIGEEFGVVLDLDGFEQFASFEKLLAYLKDHPPDA